MLSKTRILLASVLAALLAAAVSAETLDQILAAVAEQSAATKDMTCSMKMEIDVMKQQVRAEGQVKFKAPDKMAMVQTTFMTVAERQVVTKMRVVSDGAVLFQEVSPAGGKTIVNRVDLVAAGVKATGGVKLPMGTIEDLKSLTEAKVLEDKVLEDGENAWVIAGKSTAAAPAEGGDRAEKLNSLMGRTRIYVGQKSRVIRRMEFLSEEDKPVGWVAFDDVKLNVGLGDEEFRYVPPAGVPVEDQTELMKRNHDAVEAAKKSARPAEAAPGASGLAAGTPAPALTPKGLDGGAIDLRAMRGRRVLVIFWAAWNPGSLDRLVEADRLAKQRKDFDVLAVSLDDPGVADTVKKALAAKGVSATSGLGTSSDLKAWRIARLPAWVLVDAEGKVVAGEGGAADLVALKAALEKPSAK